MFARLAVALIRLYQRWISPYKGYRCAHRALHGGASCSEYGIAVVQSGGVLSLWPRLRARFAECRAAAATIRLMRSQAGEGGEAGEQRDESDEQRKQRSDDEPPPWLCMGDCCVDFGGEAACGACDFDGCG